MTKILVLYYSTYGHVETLAKAVAEGARSVAGVEVTVKRVPETMSPEVAKRYGAKLDQAAPRGGRPRSPGRTVRASPAQRNFPWRAFKAHTSRKLQRSFKTDPIPTGRSNGWLENKTKENHYAYFI